MSKTLKKTLSIVLTILMIATTAPFAFAAESDGVMTPIDISTGKVVIADSYVTVDGNFVDTDSDGYILTGSSYGVDNVIEICNYADAAVTYDIVFDNLYVSAGAWCSAFRVKGESPIILNIKVIGTNTFRMDDFCLFSNQGNSTLTVNLAYDDDSEIVVNRANKHNGNGLLYESKSDTYVNINGTPVGKDFHIHTNTDAVQTCGGYICSVCGEFYGEAKGDHTDVNENYYCDICDVFFVKDEIKVGDTYTVTKQGVSYVKFIPVTNSTFTLTSENATSSLFVELYDDKLNYQGYDFVENDSFAFEYRYYKAGKVYYFKIVDYYNENDYTFTLECEHSGEWVDEVAADCENDGSIAHFHCEYCYTNFDEEHNVIDDVTIPALGHKDDDGDYLCDNGCGHEFENPTEPDEDICEHCGKEHNTFIDDIICKIKRFFVLINNFLSVIVK